MALRVKVKNISVNSRLASEESLFENVHHAQQLPCLVRYTNSIVVLHRDWHFVCAGSIEIHFLETRITLTVLWLPF